MGTRRDFLKEASLLAGGMGLWSSLPASVQKALAINPAPGTTFEDAEHIVFLMQENRSFDHCFGTLQGVRGFNDPRAITIPGKRSVWVQENERGESYVPFRLNMKDTRATWMGGLPHSWPNQVDARNNGKYDKWLIAKKAGGDYRDMPLTLGYYNREDIPFYYSLADAFTVCDQNFSSSLTGTTANRSHFWTGTIRENPEAIACVLNGDTYYNREASWKTFPERLEEHGVSWRVYQNEISLQTGLEDKDESWLSNFTDNNLEWFKQYNVRFHKAHYDFMIRRIGELPGEIKSLEKQLKGLKQNQAAKLEKELNQKKEQLVKYKSESKKWSPENFEKLSEFQKSIHRRSFTTNVGDPEYYETNPFEYEENGIKRELRLPKGDVLYQFRQDVHSGRLPTVSWLVAPQYFSDHPSAPWFGAWYVSEVLDILTKNPEVWKKTIFILNYDENDGYFDHIPPFTAPKPGDVNSGKTSDDIDTGVEYVTMEEEMRRTNIKKEDARESSIGLGYRVPLIIASPWSRGGWVNSQVFDITSTIRFMEKFLSKKTGKEIVETNISDWRRTVTGDLTSAFRPYNGERINLPDFVEKEKFVKEIYNAKFKEPPVDYRPLSNEQINDISGARFSPLLPGQETGTRPSCSLPYELLAEGKLTDDKKSIEIDFSVGSKIFGNKSAGSPFNVYAPYGYNEGLGVEEARSWAFAVKANDSISYKWPLNNFQDGQYHLRVYGPNGFYREFKGDKNDPQLDIRFGYEESVSPSGLTGNVVVILENPEGKDYEIYITDNGYGYATQTIRLSGATLAKKEVLNLKSSYGWYDISVTVKGYDGFEKRYAGRVESGEHSRTDPVMGRESK